MLYVIRITSRCLLQLRLLSLQPERQILCLCSSICMLRLSTLNDFMPVTSFEVRPPQGCVRSDGSELAWKTKSPKLLSVCWSTELRSGWTTSSRLRLLSRKAGSA